MPADYKPSQLSQRFLRIVDVVLKEHPEKLKNDSDLSRLLSNGSDRGVIARVRAGSNEPSPKQISRMAEQFNIDFNAFYRDIDQIYFKPHLYNKDDNLVLREVPANRMLVNGVLPNTDSGKIEKTLVEILDFLSNWEHQSFGVSQKLKGVFVQKLEWLKRNLEEVGIWVKQQTLELAEAREEVVLEKDNAMNYMKKVIDLLEKESK